jgi:sarcosine oxidase
VDRAEAERLAAMPSIIYRLDGDPTLVSIYALPPILYPDGYTYVKIGGTLCESVYRSSHAEFVEWFHGEGNPVETDAVKSVLLDIILGLRAESFHTRPCVVTYTATDHPYIDVLDGDDPAAGHIFVAAGGCGSAAKSSNEIGRIAALFVANGAWSYDIDASTFKSVFL